MKKMLLMAALAVATLTANAQVWIGGSLGYNYSKNGDLLGNKHTITISPEVGYNLSEKWAIAAALNVDFATGGTKALDASITPYARYTFAKTGIASFFVDGGFSVGGYKLSGSSTKFMWGIGFQPGVAIELSKKVCLVTKLGYLGYRDNRLDKNFAIGLYNDASLGLYYSF